MIISLNGIYSNSLFYIKNEVLSLQFVSMDYLRTSFQNPVYLTSRRQ